MAPLIPEGIFSIPFYLNHTSSSPQDDEILKMWKKLSYCIGEIQIRRIGVIIVGPSWERIWRLSTFFHFSLSFSLYSSFSFVGFSYCIFHLVTSWPITDHHSTGLQIPKLFHSLSVRLSLSLFQTYLQIITFPPIPYINIAYTHIYTQYSTPHKSSQHI